MNTLEEALQLAYCPLFPLGQVHTIFSIFPSKKILSYFYLLIVCILNFLSNQVKLHVHVFWLVQWDIKVIAFDANQMNLHKVLK